MLKSDLIHKLATQNPHLYEQDVSNIVNVVVTEIIYALRDGRRIELRGLGSISTKPGMARTGRNPRTGTSVNVDAKRAPIFR